MRGDGTVELAECRARLLVLRALALRQHVSALMQQERCRIPCCVALYDYAHAVAQLRPKMR